MDILVYIAMNSDSNLAIKMQGAILGTDMLMN